MQLTDYQIEIKGIENIFIGTGCQKEKFLYDTEVEEEEGKNQATDKMATPMIHPVAERIWKAKRALERPVEVKSGTESGL